MSASALEVAVMGAGSWGTALAKHMADLGHRVTLWTRREAHAAEMERDRENARYLPGCRLPEGMMTTASAEHALERAELVISVVPSQHTREVWTAARAHLPSGVPIICASKGIENGSLDLMVTVLEAVLPGHPIGFVGGPSFAKEVALHQPTAVVIASENERLAAEGQAAISSDWLRAYRTDDVVGVEIGGALKNVVAIACGIADGLGLGLNTRAAIITRGLAEITRLAVRLGADPQTLAGLAGMGDLVLTCTGDLSRNRRVGIALGQGRPLDEILAATGQVAEGVSTTLAARDLAVRTGVQMPIAQEVHAVLYEGRSAKECVLQLMRRSLKSEAE